MVQVVFVGNVPYDVTEEQLTAIFSEVGPIAAPIHMVYDKDSGKPKGYGFISYHDRETAASAVRNLNGYDINGRQLNVDFSDKDGSSVSGGAPPPAKRQKQDAPSSASPAASLDTTTSINNYVSGANTQQLLDLFSQIKLLVSSNPIAAKQLLQTNPQLTYGLFQAMVTTNIIDASVLNQLLPPTTAANAPPPAAAPLVVDQQQQQLLMQVLALSPAQIAILPPAQQEDIRLLKSKFGMS